MKFKKNPKMHLVVIPGVGRLTPDTVLEGAQYEKFTRREFGAMLVPFDGTGPVKKDEVKKDEAPVTAVVQPPVRATVSSEHVVGNQPPAHTPALARAHVPPLKTESLLPREIVEEAEEAEEASGKTTEKVKAEVEADANADVEADADAASEDSEESEETEEGDEESEGAPIEEGSVVLDTMSARRLKKLADAHDIKIPKSVKGVAAVREHLRGILFPPK